MTEARRRPPGRPGGARGIGALETVSLYLVSIGASALLVALWWGLLQGWWYWVVLVNLVGAGIVWRFVRRVRVHGRELDLPPGVPIDAPPPRQDARAGPTGPAPAGWAPAEAVPPGPVPFADPIAVLRVGRSVQAAALCPTRPYLAQGLAGGDVALWHIGTPTRPRLAATLPATAPTIGPATVPATESGHDPGGGDTLTAVAFHPSGDLLATGGPGAGLWDLTAPDGPRQVARHAPTEPAQAMAAVAFSPDGRFLATAGNDAGILLWDVTVPTTPRQLAVLDPGTQKHRPSRLTLLSGTVPPPALAFHPARALLVARAHDHHDRDAVRLIDLGVLHKPTWCGDVTLYEHKGFYTGTDGWPGVYDLAISPDGALLATASEATFLATNGQDRAESWREAEIGLWSLTAPLRLERVAGLRERGTLHDALAHAFTRRTRGQRDRLARTLTGHATLTRAVAFHPHRRLLATAGDDHTILIWDLTHPHRPRPVDAILLHDTAHHLAFLPEADLVAATSTTQTTYWPTTHHPARVTAAWPEQQRRHTRHPHTADQPPPAPDHAPTGGPASPMVGSPSDTPAPGG